MNTTAVSITVEPATVYAAVQAMEVKATALRKAAVDAEDNAVSRELFRAATVLDQQARELLHAVRKALSA